MGVAFPSRRSPFQLQIEQESRKLKIKTEMKIIVPFPLNLF